MMNILSLVIGGLATLILLDFGCYFWLRRNDSRRLLPTERLRRPA